MRKMSSDPGFKDLLGHLFEALCQKAEGTDCILSFSWLLGTFTQSVGGMEDSPCVQLPEAIESNLKGHWCFEVKVKSYLERTGHQKPS